MTARPTTRSAGGVGQALADRQLAVDESLIGYLLSRIERPRRRRRWWEGSTAAMRRQRPLTRALAAELWREGEP
jgi:hypothetical protein